MLHDEVVSYMLQILHPDFGTNVRITFKVHCT